MPSLYQVTWKLELKPVKFRPIGLTISNIGFIEGLTPDIKAFSFPLANCQVIGLSILSDLYLPLLPDFISKNRKNTHISVQF